MIRRSFLRWVCGIIWTACSAVVAIPIVRFVLAPLKPRDEEREAITRLVTPLAELEPGVPRKFALIGRRVDAWTVYPNQPIGHVWLIRQSDEDEAAESAADADTQPASDTDTGANVEGAETEVQSPAAVSPAPVIAYSATCPHLGCMIQQDAESNHFVCPCHKAAFDLDGATIESGSGTENPSPRGMDQLDCRIVSDEQGVEWVEVAYQTFELGTREPIPKS